MQQIQWSWQFSDPFEEQIGWDYLFNSFRDRYQDTIHAIYRMIGHHRANIAKRAIELQRVGNKQMALDFPDPLQKFKEAFTLLLAPKTLADIDINNPQILYKTDGIVLQIDSLSSGEREVLSIAFDLLLRGPEDCIIFFDEPELHLHPELSFRLLKTLQTIGARNQFVFCTHSADIISASIEHSVVFVSRQGKNGNQGILVKPNDESVLALKELGQNLGVISLGRKIVLVEGAERSLDRDTYGAIIQGLYPQLVIAPSGSRQTILSFAKVVEEVLDRTIWGVEFFMVGDRDNSLPADELKRLEERAGGKLKFLSRYHLENYFLDEETIAESFRDLVAADHWLRQPNLIREKLIELARERVPHAVNLWLSTQLRSYVGEIDVSLKDVVGKDVAWFEANLNNRLDQEKERVLEHLDPSRVKLEVERRWKVLETSLGDSKDDWKIHFPGKPLIAGFCSDAKIERGHFRSLYISAARRTGMLCFRELLSIFSEFESKQLTGRKV